MMEAIKALSSVVALIVGVVAAFQNDSTRAAAFLALSSSLYHVHKDKDGGA